MWVFFSRTTAYVTHTERTGEEGAATLASSPLSRSRFGEERRVELPGNRMRGAALAFTRVASALGWPRRAARERCKVRRLLIAQ